MSESQTARALKSCIIQCVRVGDNPHFPRWWHFTNIFFKLFINKSHTHNFTLLKTARKYLFRCRVIFRAPSRNNVAPLPVAGSLLRRKTDFIRLNWLLKSNINSSSSDFHLKFFEEEQLTSINIYKCEAFSLPREVWEMNGNSQHIPVFLFAIWFTDWPDLRTRVFLIIINNCRSRVNKAKKTSVEITDVANIPVEVNNARWVDARQIPEWVAFAEMVFSRTCSSVLAWPTRCTEDEWISARDSHNLTRLLHNSGADAMTLGKALSLLLLTGPT